MDPTNNRSLGQLFGFFLFPLTLCVSLCRTQLGIPPLLKSKRNTLSRRSIHAHNVKSQDLFSFCWDLNWVASSQSKKNKVVGTTFREKIKLSTVLVSCSNRLVRFMSVRNGTLQSVCDDSVFGTHPEFCSGGDRPANWGRPTQKP